MTTGQERDAVMVFVVEGAAGVKKVGMAGDVRCQCSSLQQAPASVKKYGEHSLDY